VIRLNISCLVVLFSVIVHAAQEVYTEHPPVTTGAFANFSYPAWPILGNSAAGDSRKTFTLKRGVFRPAFGPDGYIIRTGAYLKAVDLIDVTGDGVNEGIATLGPIHPGNAVWYGIYIYSLSGKKPTTLLWSFATGDRGVGGLKKVFGRKGNLVVELWGWNSGPNRPPTSHIEAQAGSSYYTRRTYKWNGRHFAQVGKSRIIYAP